MSHLFFFLACVLAVSAVNALLKPVPLKKTAKEGFVLFFTTVAGMGAVALVIHFLSV